MASGVAMAGDASPFSHRSENRLLWLIDSLTMGGAEALVIPFAKRASQRGVELTICARTSIGGNPLEAELRSTGVRVENLGARTLRDVPALLRLSRLVREVQPDIIHSHLTYAAIWGALVARRHHVPLVASLHVPPASNAGAREWIRQRMMVALLNRLAARVIMVSEALGSEWIERSRLERTKIAIVHNGIEIDRSSARGPQAVREELGIGAASFVVATVAVLRRGKGIEVLLEAAAKLTRKGSDCIFIIVGEGPMGEEWRRLSDELGLARTVIWTGFRRDVSSCLAGADLFVLPTFSDAFPTVLLEAFAAGLPVIASDVGGVPEIVDDGRTGMLVPPGDAGVLAERIRSAMKDEAWRRRAGAAGREKVEQQFSVESWYARLDDLYGQVLNEREAGRGDRS